MPTSGSRQGSYEFVPMPDSPKPSKCPSGYAVAVFAVIAAVLFAGGVLIGYYLRQGWDGRSCREPAQITTPAAPAKSDSVKMYDPGDRLSRHQRVLQCDLSNSNMFSNWSDEVVLSSSDTDKEIVSMLPKDNQSSISHVIDYPDLKKHKSNFVQVLDNSGKVIKEFRPQSESLPGSAFVDFTIDGSEQGEVVFVNEGRIQDYETAVSKGVRLNAKIVIIKLSASVSVPEQRRVADMYGIKAILLYEEPSLDEECDHYAPTLSAWRLMQHQSPYILVQPISCQTALHLLSRISGISAPHSWVGSLNVSYQIGTSNTDSLGWKVNVTTNNGFMTRMGKSVSHVFKTIRGMLTPDKFVLIGAARTSLFSNKAQSSSNMLLQLYELLLSMQVDKSWQPIRSIRFVWWAGNEFGPVGTAAFIREYQEAYRDNILAYVDVESFHSDSDMIQLEADIALKQLFNHKLQRNSYMCDSGSSYIGQRVSSISCGEVVKILLSVPVMKVSAYKTKSISPNVLSSTTHCMERDFGLKMAALLVMTVVDAGILQTGLVAPLDSFLFHHEQLHTLLSESQMLTTPSPLSHELEHISSTAKNLTAACNSKRENILASHNYHKDNYRSAVNTQISKTYSCIARADVTLLQAMKNLPYDKREHGTRVAVDSVMISLKQVSQYVLSAMRVLQEQLE